MSQRPKLARGATGENRDFDILVFVGRVTRHTLGDLQENTEVVTVLKQRMRTVRWAIE